ncbi:hypothetical protein FRC08_004539 [Ceratobasidium sp. 394]|nr:hypothetical protein FRC08_004539 [Ceratobasidium sp. 394]
MSFYALLNAIPQTATPGPRGLSTPYSLPCSTALAISLELNGANLTIPTHDLIAEHRNSAHPGTCISNLRTWVDPSENALVLGSLFMHTLHVTGSAGECFAVANIYKRYSSENNHWRGAVIGGTIGGVTGAALLVVGAFFLFRFCRGAGARQRGDRAARSLESAQPTELQPRQQLDRSAKPHPSPPPSHSPDISIPLQPAAAPVDAETAPTAGPSSRPQLPPHLGLHRTDREVRASTGSQFTEHFGDIAPEYIHNSKSRTPLAGKPLPHIPFYPPPPSTSGQAEGSSRPEPQLSFVPFDAHAQRQGAGSSRKSSTSPKNSLPPGAASPVESVGSYKPAEQPHSRDVSI